MEKTKGGWSKLHSVLSINDVSAMSLSITNEHVHDAKTGKELLRSVNDRIRRIFEDRGYDSRAIYNSFGNNTAISPRKKASTRSRGLPARERIVMHIRRTSEKEWKETVDCGKRWHVEIHFSGFVRDNGREVIKAVRPDYIVQEIALKVPYYNILLEMTHAY